MIVYSLYNSSPTAIGRLSDSYRRLQFTGSRSLPFVRMGMTDADVAPAGTAPDLKSASNKAVNSGARAHTSPGAPDSDGTWWVA